MNISDNVYISNSIRHPRRLLRRFRANKIIPGVFIIRQAAPPDELEIIRADFFKQKSLRADPRPILAFLKNYGEAVSFVVDITEKSNEAYGFPDLNRYINEMPKI